MIGGIVELLEDGRHFSVYRGFMKVSEDKKEIGRVPLDDISSIILSAQHTTFSGRLFAELAKRKATLVFCGRDYHPISITFPFNAHHEAAGILQDQIAASTPLKKRLWQDIVRSKIYNQITVLNHVDSNSTKIEEMASLLKQVRSGDPDNREAQAARLYWPAVMGEKFRRGSGNLIINSFLNYGYAILRASVARAVCGAGLHPALGLHHHNRQNSFVLVDDLMEPYRPLIDLIARRLFLAGKTELTPETKREIAIVLQQNMRSENGISPVVLCLQRTAIMLVSCLKGHTKKLYFAKLIPSGSLL